MTAVLQVEGLSVSLRSGLPIVEDVSLVADPGQVLGLVGESGSGKTTVALALLGFARPGARISSGTVMVDGHEVTGRREAVVRALRGRLISYVPQDPSTSLNPSVRIGDAISEMAAVHGGAGAQPGAVAEALRCVQLPDEATFLRRFPHQLSGGQQQRVAIAMALVCGPRVAVLDEPTTGLDVITQARLLEQVDRLRHEIGVTIVYVSHDLAVVASIADRLAVMYAGRVVEQGLAADVLAQPRHPYTRGLLQSVPDPQHPRRLVSIGGVSVGVGERPPGCSFAPRCPQRIEACDRAEPPLEAVGDEHAVRCIEWRRTPPLLRPERDLRVGAAGTPLLAVEGLRAEHAGRGGTTVAAADVSFELARGECLALVGESGSGKTTIARCIAGLHVPSAGTIALDGAPLAGRAAGRTTEARRRVQIVFQNPYDSLNPRHRVRDAIARPARVLRGLAAAEADAEVHELLERVRLPERIGARFPAELSGGERQRVAIARALAAHPDLMVCDEITSALDVSVQAAVLELLARLRAELGLALLFITHDLGVVASIADRVLVLEAGRICEQGAVGPLLGQPAHPYTRSLVGAAPRLPEPDPIA